MTNSIPYLQQAIEWNDQLRGLPATPFMVVWGLGVGYACKAFPFVSNKWIPTIVIFSCSVGNVLVDIAAVSSTNWFRQLALGFIAGCFAWYLHNKWLWKYEQPKTSPPAQE